ncbi:GH32 C-terminal domain-containing protein [Bacillus sp. FJAT-50079]|uniref:GH32 C-terminal domain-containing protein n=1 Tax=Bacillus sp. FJAT-50079 TaxID=2833577 RepID=UPI001BCA5A13|nr:GH32 C-terminal domain-containing protein [Bacillus sp. FJAT-50079]MBS4206584.1 GH32 C-terminal domain-containing protein [Bacillus sp. FJAT-50079]
MHKLYYQPEGYWFGDCMPFYYEGKFYLFHQRDARNPGPLPLCAPFGWDLVLTSDFVHYEDKGEALKKGKDDAQDQFIYAGSVYEANGTFHAMYTGFNRDYPKYGKDSQVLMKATSTDLLNWEKTNEILVSPQEGYDPDDWRDPFVFWDDDSQEYIMILGARKLQGNKVLTGCTVYFTSKDFDNWDFKGDLWAPNLYSMHEMPDMFKMGEYWYQLITEYSNESKTIYRMSKSLDGPWVAPVDDAFDGRAYYAARSFSDGDKRYLFGWVATKENEDDLGNWQWGGTLVVHEVYQREDGSLGVKIPDSVYDAFDNKEKLNDEPIRLSTVDSSEEVHLAKDIGDFFKFEATIKFSPGTRSIGIRLFEDIDTGDAYEYMLNIGENKLNFDRTPNQPWNRYFDKGLERLIQLKGNKEYNIQIIVDGTIATLYVDGVALNVRMYSKPGSSLGIHVVDGDLEIKNTSIEKSLK